MVSLSRANLERALSGKLRMEIDERDHRVYRLFVGGRLVVRTMVSTGTGHRTLGDPLVAAIAKQLGVTAADLRAIVSCTIDRPGYLQRLRDAGVLVDDDESSPNAP